MHVQYCMTLRMYNTVWHYACTILYDITHVQCTYESHKVNNLVSAITINLAKVYHSCILIWKCINFSNTWKFWHSRVLKGIMYTVIPHVHKIRG